MHLTVLHQDFEREPMNTIETITKLRNGWKDGLQADEDLNGAWVNVNNMMFKGNITALMGASKLIAQMDWWNGLTEWIDFNSFEQPIISKSIHIEERALYAYVLLHCRYLAQGSRSRNWFQTIGQQLDWGMISISAASVPTLGEIPDWLMEPLILGCLHEVHIPLEDTHRHLWMHAFPITQALFETITEENPSMSLGLMHPVDSVSWYDAIQFCNQLSEAMGYDPVYDINNTNITISSTSNGYRLPTTAEWIQAARHNGNPQWAFAGHNELWMVGVYDANTSDHIGRHKPTPSGLYDMSGNIWEWCWSDDPLYAYRKGGSWISKDKACELDFVSRRLKTYANPAQGLRLCRIEVQTKQSETTAIDDWDW